MKVLIIEDEKHASDRLVRLLREADPSIEVCNVLGSVESSVNWFLTNPRPDLIFMDIQLEDGLCFEIYDAIALDTPVIFTTAYNEYTLKAFKVNSVDYLLKPVATDDLSHSLEKFSNLHRTFVNVDNIGEMVQQMMPKTKERFLIRIGEHIRSVPVSSIHCFFIEDKCVFANVAVNKNYPLDYSLERIESMINAAVFFRINRNYIVHFDAITDMVIYSSNRLKISVDTLPGKEQLIVSRERIAAFRRWIDR
ncbi:MAG: response regulator transcription factor [Bacteroidales bacterium]|jgi:DNA-binding LytR/AlgR family response regulator|nr:response regulator transcription factor [Bacteroidales bacterium]